MQSFCLEAERGLEGAKTTLFLFLGDPLVLARAPGKSLENQRGGTQMATSSIDCIFTVSRDHLDEGRKALKKMFLS